MPRGKKDSISTRRLSLKPAGGNLDFADVVTAIRQVHKHCAAQAKLAVNMNLTLRNWAIGWSILEYEQNGSDRAQYGEGLIETLAERLKSEGLERMDSRELRRYRLFYMTYPGIRESLTPEFGLPLEKLFSALADRLQTLDIPNCSKSWLYRYRDFFKLYSQIVATPTLLSGRASFEGLLLKTEHGRTGKLHQGETPGSRGIALRYLGIEAGMGEGYEHSAD